MSSAASQVSDAGFVARSGYPLPNVFSSVVHMLASAVERNPDGEALVVGDVRLDYSDLVASVGDFARALRSEGCAGDRVAIAIPNSADAVIALLGTLASGAQAVLINPTYSGREFEHVMRDADPLLLICDEARLQSARDVIVAATRRQPIVLGGQDGKLVRRRQPGAGLPDPLPQPDQLAKLLYTGGTTGRSKGVNLSHRTLSLNISQREAMLPGRPLQERFLCMTPLFHAYASAMVLYPALYAASTAVFLPRYKPESALSLVASEKITLFAGAPTIYNGLVKHPQFTKTDFTTLVGAYSGAAPLSVETLEIWERVTGVPIAEGYGLTEATGMLCFNPLYGQRKVGSVGPPMPETMLEIVDLETGTQRLPVGSLGEVRARGPQMMVGYRNQPEETANMIRDGWLYTGDIGELDADGYLFIRDRKKDMAIVSGYNVYPREIDEVLYAHPAVVEAAAAGVPDSYRGEVIEACVCLREGSGIGETELIAHCAANLVAYKVPARIHLVADVPKTAAGKIDRKAARSLLKERRETEGR